MSVTQTKEERKSKEFISLTGLPVVLPLAASLNESYVSDETEQDDFDFWFNEGRGSQSGGPTGPSQVWFVARHPLGVPVHLKAGRLSPDLSLWKTSLNGRMLSAGYSVNGFSWTGSQSGLEFSSFLGSRVMVVGMNDRNNSTATEGPATVNEKGEVVAGQPAEADGVNG